MAREYSGITGNVGTLAWVSLLRANCARGRRRRLDPGTLGPWDPGTLGPMHTGAHQRECAWQGLTLLWSLPGSAAPPLPCCRRRLRCFWGRAAQRRLTSTHLVGSEGLLPLFVSAARLCPPSARLCLRRAAALGSACLVPAPAARGLHCTAVHRTATLMQCFHSKSLQLAPMPCAKPLPARHPVLPDCLPAAGVVLWEICTAQTPVRGQLRDVRWVAGWRGWVGGWVGGWGAPGLAVLKGG